MLTLIILCTVAAICCWTSVFDIAYERPLRILAPFRFARLVFTSFRDCLVRGAFPDDGHRDDIG